LKAAGQPWTPDLCASCPVPEISLANACTYMQLNPTVGRSLSSAFMKRVQLKAYCDKSKKSVKEPHVGCGECHALPFDFKVRS